MTKLVTTASSFEQLATNLLSSVTGGDGDGILFLDPGTVEPGRTTRLPGSSNSETTFVSGYPKKNQQPSILNLDAAEAKIKKAVDNQILGFPQSQNDPFTFPGKIGPANPGDPTP